MAAHSTEDEGGSGAHDPSEFWSTFTYVASTNTDVLQRIISYMPAGGAACLRGVNVAWRGAVNRTVQVVVCKISALPAGVDLGTVFPEAYTLRLELQYSKGAAVVKPDAVAQFLVQFESASPALVQRVQSLQLCMQFVTDVESTAEPVAAFLLR